MGVWIRKDQGTMLDKEWESMPFSPRPLAVGGFGSYRAHSWLVFSFLLLLFYETESYLP